MKFENACTMPIRSGPWGIRTEKDRFICSLKGCTLSGFSRPGQLAEDGAWPRNYVKPMRKGSTGVPCLFATPLEPGDLEKLQPTEQRRFLRHLGASWDTHRHRCAPEIMAVKNQLQAEGRLVCHRGYIKGYEPMDEQVEVTYRPRGTTQENKLRVRHVLSCTGPQSDYRKLNDPLVKQLLVRNLFAPNPLRIGALTAEGGVLVHKQFAFQA